MVLSVAEYNIYIYIVCQTASWVWRIITCAQLQAMGARQSWQMVLSVAEYSIYIYSMLHSELTFENFYVCVALGNGRSRVTARGTSSSDGVQYRCKPRTRRNSPK